MRTIVLIGVLFPLVAAPVVLVVSLVLVRSRPAAAPTSPRESGADPASTTWFVELGGGPGSTYGTFRLAGDLLAFVPDGSTRPAWEVPCRDLWVRREGVGPFAITAVRLHGPMGEVGCNVSREHINRFMTNSAKSFREAGYAAQFVTAVQAQGARVA